MDLGLGRCVTHRIRVVNDGGCRFAKRTRAARRPVEQLRTVIETIQQSFIVIIPPASRTSFHICGFGRHGLRTLKPVSCEYTLNRRHSSAYSLASILKCFDTRDRVRLVDRSHTTSRAIINFSLFLPQNVNLKSSLIMVLHANFNVPAIDRFLRPGTIGFASEQNGIDAS